MKKLFILLTFVLFPCCLFAQTWEQVKKDTETYIWGEGWGETIDEAEQQALASLISKLSVVVSSSFEVLEGETRDGDSEEYKKYMESKINTYSNATLTNTESLVLSN